MVGWRVAALCLVAISCSLAAPSPKVDYVVLYKELDGKKPVVASTSSEALNAEFVSPNPVNETYPLLPAGQYVWKDSESSVVKPNEVDPNLKDTGGVPAGMNVFKYSNDKHPMEVKTPLAFDTKPCSLDRVLTVHVDAGDTSDGYSYPVLPSRYGCSADNEISREKASPAVTWSNYTAGEVKEFSLQMISMGEQCTGEGSDGFNRIHWHVVGMKTVPNSVSMTLMEGASKDRRLLYGGHELPNQWLEEYYGGPCPTPGVIECFRFKVLAHLHDGQTCYCGHEDVLFLRPVQPKKPPPIPVIYETPVLAPIGRKAN